ncbi:aminopeptidase N [Scaptodrosophila lebanonensis]|uniref:Aminopeptidase n=1 Tax=Drosophila lebanonensis TaxID=7225 RepID=A0A6J2UFS8_DROLE|nr:aminopeptidase N [Scaptodrosophila lebanonensis]XP_030386995.1 aminopeptidase N [Scaptodrosophila lebanonensis]
MYWPILLLIFAVASTQPTYDYFRLPRAVEPQHYDLRILTHLDDPEKLRFEGSVKIKLNVLEDTKNITLHAKNLTIDGTNIMLRELAASNSTKCIDHIELNTKYEYYIIQLCTELRAGLQHELTIPFEGVLNGNRTGYYKSSYKDVQLNKTHWFSMTQFSPTFARLAFPCFDEPDRKATFRITLGYHKQYRGFTNTPLHKCEPHASLENYVWCEHEKLLRTSTYLVAYAVHNLTNASTIISDARNRVEFRSWIRPDAVNQTKYFSQFAPKVFAYIEELCNLSFPLNKIDQLITQDHKFSAMENWGLVTFQDKAFLYDERNTSTAAMESTAKTIAHEYAHQWFGNLVTMKWWDNLWLKEGFSTYFAYLGIDHEQPDWNFSLRQIRQTLGQFFHNDAFEETTAISRAVEGPIEILENFSTYVYEKGALMVRMLHKILGDDSFFAGIHSYLQRHAYSNVDEADLWRAFDEVTLLGVNLSTWTLQRGYPLVSVERNYSTSTAILSQKRFLLLDKEGEDCWWVPITYARQRDMNFERTQPTLWLQCPTVAETELTHIAGANEWIILNPQVNSIYRVNYDEHNWRLIIETLNSASDFDRIHVLNRAQLLDDMMALAWKGPQSYKMAFNMLAYLPLERDLLPWQAATSSLGRIQDLLTIEQADIYKIYMQKLLTPLYQRLRRSTAMLCSPRQPEQIEFERLVYRLACRYNVSDCVPWILGYYTGAPIDALAVPVDLRDIVYCTAIEHGSEIDFQLILSHFKNSTIPSQKIAFGKALGCTRSFQHLQKVLDSVLNSSEVKIREHFPTIVEAASRNPHIAREARTYFLNSAEIVVEKFVAKELKRTIYALPAGVTSRKEYESLTQQFVAFKKFDELTKHAAESSLINLQWIENRSGEFFTELKKVVEQD